MVELDHLDKLVEVINNFRKVNKYTGHKANSAGINPINHLDCFYSRFTSSMNNDDAPNQPKHVAASDASATLCMNRAVPSVATMMEPKDLQISVIRYNTGSWKLFVLAIVFNNIHG